MCMCLFGVGGWCVEERQKKKTGDLKVNKRINGVN